MKPKPKVRNHQLEYLAAILQFYSVTGVELCNLNNVTIEFNDGTTYKERLNERD